MAISHVKSNTIANFTGTVTVFGSDGATKTAAASNLVLPSDWNSVHNQYMTISGNTVGVSTVSGTDIVLQGGNNIVLSGTNQTIIISASAQSIQTQNMVSVNGSTGAIVFSNSNNITFGGNASTITASFAGLTTARASNDAIGLNSALTPNGVSVTANSSGLSLNFPAFLTTARASNDAIGTNTAQSNVTWTADSRGISLNAAGYAGTGTTFNAANISGSITLNSVGMNMSLSAAAPGVGGGIAASIGGNSTSGGAGYSNITSGTMVLKGGNNITLSQDGANITISGANAGGAQTGISGIVANGSTFTSGSVYFSNLGNISISSSVNGASQYVQLSGNAAQTVQPMYYSASGTSSSSGTIQFGNTQGVSFSLSNGSIVGSVKTDYQSSNANYLTNQSVQPMYYSASGTSSSSGTLQFGNTQGVSFSLSNGSVVGSVKTDYQSSNANYLTSQSNQAFSAGAASSAFQTLSFNDSNGISFSNNAGAIRITHDLQYTSATSAITSNAFSAANTTKFAGTGTSVTGGATITLDSLGIKFNGTALAGTGTTFTGTNVSGSMTLNSNGLNLALSAGAGGANPTASASNGSFTFQTLGFSNANNVTFGTSAGSIITASVAAPGAAAENNWMTLLGANVSSNSSASGSTIGWSGQNITLAGTNNSQIIISAPAVSSLVGQNGISISSNGSTITIQQGNQSWFAWPSKIVQGTQTQSVAQSTSVIFPFEVQNNENFAFLRMLHSISISSMASLATTANLNVSVLSQAATFNFVIYSRGIGANSQSLQSLASTQHTSGMNVSLSANNVNGSNWTLSHNFSFPNSTTASAGFATNYATTLSNLNASSTHLTVLTGMKFMDFPWATALTPGNYWLAFGISSNLTTSQNASYSRFSVAQSHWAQSQVNTTMGEFGAVSNSTIQMQYGIGSITSGGTAGTQASIAFNAISSSASHPIPFFSLAKIA